MNRRHLTWRSPHLGGEESLVCYGHFGRPLLLFPTATADHLEYERFGLIDALGPLLTAGAVKVYSVGSINSRAWMNPRVSAPACLDWQEAYNRYLTDEVVPFIREDCRSPEVRVGVGGLSFGCFHAANQFFRRPDLFDTLLGVSGTYALSDYCPTYVDDRSYFNSPRHFVGGLTGAPLKLLKKSSVIRLYSGRRRESPKPARALARVLRRKRIPYRVDVIPKGSHDWVWWNRVLPRYVHEVYAGGPPLKRRRAARRRPASA